MVEVRGLAPRSLRMTNRFSTRLSDCCFLTPGGQTENLFGAYPLIPFPSRGINGLVSLLNHAGLLVVGPRSDGYRLSGSEFKRIVVVSFLFPCFRRPASACLPIHHGRKSNLKHPHAAIILRFSYYSINYIFFTAFLCDYIGIFCAFLPLYTVQCVNPRAFISFAAVS